MMRVHVVAVRNISSVTVNWHSLFIAIRLIKTLPRLEGEFFHHLYFHTTYTRHLYGR